MKTILLLFSLLNAVRSYSADLFIFQGISIEKGSQIIVKEAVKRNGDTLAPGLRKVLGVASDGTIVVESNRTTEQFILKPSEYIPIKEMPRKAKVIVKEGTKKGKDTLAAGVRDIIAIGTDGTIVVESNRTTEQFNLKPSEYTLVKNEPPETEVVVQDGVKRGRTTLATGLRHVLAIGEDGTVVVESKKTSEQFVLSPKEFIPTSNCLLILKNIARLRN